MDGGLIYGYSYIDVKEANQKLDDLFSLKEAVCFMLSPEKISKSWDSKISNFSEVESILREVLRGHYNNEFINEIINDYKEKNDL